MVTSIYADTTPLLEAVAAADRDAVIRETLELLGHRNALPAKVAAPVGLAALWGNASPHALSAFASVGRLAEWMRSIPSGPEPKDDDRRVVAPVLPLAQGFLAVSSAVKKGLPEPHPALPEALLPAEVKNDAGVVGGMRDAFAKKDIGTIQRILVGYFATGTDYKSFQSALFAALAHRYPENGHPLIFTFAGMRVLDMAEWGNHEPAFISWLPPVLADDSPDTAAAGIARTFAADTTHDLGWLRTRLAPAREEAAGAQFQQALMAGDGNAACEATLTALRNGATTRGVLSGMALAVAQRLNAVPEGNRDELLHVGHVLQYVNAVHAAVSQVQDPVVFPMVYTAACAVNALGAAAAPSTPSTPAGALTGGGLIAGTMLRTLEQQIGAGDVASAVSTARRYMQMGHPARALAGIAGSVAASTDPTNGDDLSAHAMPFVAAAGEEYLALPKTLDQNGQSALLPAMIRLAAETRGDHETADRVRSAIQAWLV